MATSGTYTYDPTVADFTDEAFERAGVSPETIGFMHVQSARRSVNLMLAHWATKGCYLWQVDQITIDCVASPVTVSYSVSATAPAMQLFDVVLRRSSVDTPMAPIDRAAYQAIPNKTSTGMPCMFWFDRDLASQTIKVWPAPDTATDDIILYRLRRTQDVTAGAQTLDLPYHWFEAFAAGLAWRLAVKFNFERVAMLKTLGEEAFASAMLSERQAVDTEMTIG